MTTNVQDSTTEPTEVAGLPTPQLSAVSQGENSKAKGEADLATQLAEVTKRLAEQDAQLRSLQSNKDKSNDRRDREIESLKKHLTPEARAEIDKAVEVRERNRDEIRAVLSEMSPTSPAVHGRTAEQEYLSRAATILDDPEMGLSQEEKTEALTRTSRKDFSTLPGSDADRIVAALAEVSKQAVIVKGLSLKQERPASMASVILPSGGSVPQKDLKSEYIKEMSAARGNRALGMSIIKKYEGLGFNTGSVDFRL
jgi:sulfite reductase alpha subunit-like flavoprotein